MHTPRLALTLLALIPLATLPAAAQLSASVGPMFGYYRPLSNFYATPILDGGLPRTPSELAGVAWGVDAKVSSGQLALRSLLVTASSSVRQLSRAPDPTYAEARVTIAALEIQYDLLPTTLPYHFAINAGPAWIQHGGAVYEVYGSPQSWGPMAGVEFSALMTQQVQLLASASAVRYNFNTAPNSAQSFEQGRLTDALMYVGLRWRH